MPSRALDTAKKSLSRNASRENSALGMRKSRERSYSKHGAVSASKSQILRSAKSLKTSPQPGHTSSLRNVGALANADMDSSTNEAPPLSHGPTKYRLISLEKRVASQQLTAKDHVEVISKKMETIKCLN